MSVPTQSGAGGSSWAVSICCSAVSTGSVAVLDCCTIHRIYYHHMKGVVGEQLAYSTWRLFSFLPMSSAVLVEAETISERRNYYDTTLMIRHNGGWRHSLQAIAIQRCSGAMETVRCPRRRLTDGWFPSHHSLLRGSSTEYPISCSRFPTIPKRTTTIVVPRMMGKSRV
jgi:hypothetical protein